MLTKAIKHVSRRDKNMKQIYNEVKNGLKPIQNIMIPILDKMTDIS